MHNLKVHQIFLRIWLISPDVLTDDNSSVLWENRAAKTVTVHHFKINLDSRWHDFSQINQVMAWWHQTKALLPAMLTIIALWWWFCPCRVGGAVWNHTAWVFPLMPLPTLSLFYSYFLSGNKYRKNITCKNIGQFQFCINLLPLELIWRSASCPRHWNQRWFGDAAFTIPSGKQWDHMSPWSPSWLSAGIDECCRSANESGHQWLKNSWLETIWH